MNNLFTLSKPAIQYLCQCINQVVSLPTDVINNINLSDTQTFSNIHIKNLIDQCLIDANEYADQVVNALTHLVAEKIDFEPTLENTTDKINTLLLYSKNSDNNYTQYLRLTNELLNLGDTSLSLTDYLKITDAASTYTKLTDFKTLSDEVAGIKTKIGTETLTTTSQTITGAINEVKTSIPTDDDIKSLADGQIDSKKQILGFSDLKGITADSTLDDVVKAVPSGKMAVLQSANFTNYLGLPHQMYTITINSLGYNRNQIIATAKYSKNPSVSFIGGCDNSSGTDIYDQWLKIPTTNDITTTINSASTDDKIPSAKAVYDKVESITIKKIIYNDSCVIENYLDTLTPDVDVLFTSNDTTGDLVTLTGEHLFMIEYRKYGSHLCLQRAYLAGNGKLIACRSKSWWAGVWGSWQKVCTTSVADVPRIELDIPTLTEGKFENAFSGNISNYSVKNGVCTLTLTVKCVTPISNLDTTIGSKILPKSANGIAYAFGFDRNMVTSTNPIMAQVDGYGNLLFGGGTAGGNYRLTISYPVAES